MSILLPDYMAAIMDDPWEFGRHLYGTHDYARMVKMGETFVPLREDERAWIED